MQALRTVYRYWAAIVFLAVLAQIAGAAYGGFYAAEKLDSQPGEEEARKLISEKTFDSGFDFHTGFGYLIFLAALLLLLLALAARVGRPRIWWNLALPIAVAVQIVLAWAGEEVPFVGGFHGFNALIVFGLSGFLAHRAWRDRMAPEPIAERTATGP